MNVIIKIKLYSCITLNTYFTVGKQSKIREKLLSISDRDQSKLSLIFSVRGRIFMNGINNFRVFYFPENSAY